MEKDSKEENANSSTLAREEENKFDLDRLIDEIGPFGKYQLKNYVLICLPIALSGLYILIFVFTAGEVNHRCWIPQCEVKRSPYQAPFLNFTIPKENDGTYSKCRKFRHLAKDVDRNQCNAEFFDPQVLEGCTDFIYEHYEESIISLWNLGCKKEWMLSLVGTINLFGHIVGQPLIGYLSDEYGRREVFILECIYTSLAGFLQSFSQSYGMFLAMEFIAALGCSGLYNTGFILAMELIGPNRFGLGVLIINVFFGLGKALLGVLAMGTENWRWLLRVSYIPMLITLAYRWLIPESVRWLMSKQRYKEAAKIISSAAKMNKSQLTSEAERMIGRAMSGNRRIKAGDEVEKDGTSLGKVLKSRIIQLRLVNCLFCWFTIFFIFFCITINAGTIGYNKYLSFILICLVELPASVGCGLVMEKIGRRLVLIVSLILSGVSCLTLIVSPNASKIVQLLIITFAKFNISMAITTVYVYTAELFPTKVRSTLVAICATSGCIGAAIAPFIIQIGKYVKSLPMILFTVLAFFASFFIFFAPETLNCSLPDTLQEAEEIGKKSRK